MTGSIQPTHAGVGDPLDLRIQISGNGNFDRVQAPVLAATPVWRVHQVTSEIEAQDDIGLIAVKTFHYPIGASAPVNGTPASSFSYFDPKKKNDMMLELDPKEVKGRGQKISRP